MRRLLTAVFRSLATVGALMPPGLGILFVNNAMAGILNVPSTYGTIQTALNAAANGDVILVGPGVYTQNLTFGNKQVALRSTAGPASTIIHVAGGVGVQLGGNSELTGFTITGAVSDFGAGAVVSGIGTLIKGNVFDGNVQTSGGLGAAIGGNSASPIIDGNTFRNNSSDFQFLSGVVSFINSSSPLIENNIFEDNPSRGVNLTLPEGNNPRVINNTFVRDTIAIRVDRRVNSSMYEFRNNIIAGNGVGLEVDFGAESLNPTWTNNLVFGNTTNYQLISNQTGKNGNISVDPMFISSANLHVLAGSPTINVGSPVHAPNHDFDGNFRPTGAGFDLGAYEFVPEPHSITLAATGIIGLGLLACRCRAHRSRWQSLEHSSERASGST
jgi:hypothetical protein